jgi:hypothetical protein
MAIYLDDRTADLKEIDIPICPVCCEPEVYSITAGRSIPHPDCEEKEYGLIGCCMMGHYGKFGKECSTCGCGEYV